jgi:hypothetical protein
VRPTHALINFAGMDEIADFGTGVTEKNNFIHAHELNCQQNVRARLHTNWLTPVGKLVR